MLKKLLEFIVPKLVDAPDKVSITEEIADGVITVKLTVAQEDLGKVIGKEGKTARAIRTLVSAAAEKAGKKATLEIVK